MHKEGQLFIGSLTLLGHTVDLRHVRPRFAPSPILEGAPHVLDLMTSWAKNDNALKRLHAIHIIVRPNFMRFNRMFAPLFKSSCAANLAHMTRLSIAMLAQFVPLRLCQKTAQV